MNVTPGDQVVFDARLAAEYATEYDQCKVDAIEAVFNAQNDDTIDGHSVCIDWTSQYMAYRSCVKQKEKVILTDLGLQNRKIPRNYREFRRDPNSHDWWAGMLREMASQQEMGSWDLEPVTEQWVHSRGKTIVSCKWVWDFKVNSLSHAITLWKARLVARGFEQGPEDFLEVTRELFVIVLYVWYARWRLCEIGNAHAWTFVPHICRPR